MLVFFVHSGWIKLLLEAVSDCEELFFLSCFSVEELQAAKTTAMIAKSKSAFFIFIESYYLVNADKEIVNYVCER